ncbi:MAG: hypothetical protein AB7O97_10570 [Planctomycetota bacterium]
MYPDYWIAFLAQHQLTNRVVIIGEGDDVSGVGADLTLLNQDKSLGEQGAYPGLKVHEHGFIPVAACNLGSGDPYFINANDGPHGPLYRIYHDAVGEDGYDDSAIDIVLKDYTDLIRHLAPD